MKQDSAPQPVWMYRSGENGTVEDRLFNDASEVPENEGWADSPANVEAEDAKEAAGQKWPPTDEQLAAMDNRALGALLKSRGGNPQSVKTADARLAAIKELIAKEAAGQ